jgi:phosphocarrier protein
VIERTVTVVPEDGLHARPASKFVETVNQYDSEIMVSKADGDKDPVNAKSILAVTGLGVKSGEPIVIRAEGDDEAEAMDALETVITTPETDEE